MSKKDSILEKALLQANMLEEAVKTNAKGILQSVMKEEIKSLVKESLTEDASDEDDDKGDEFPAQDVPSSDESGDVDTETDSEGDEAMDSGDEEPGGAPEFEELPSTDDEDNDTEEPVDMTGASDDEILRIFKKMGEEDGIIVKKEDNGDVELNIDDQEFLVKLNEDEEMEESEEEVEEQDEMPADAEQKMEESEEEVEEAECETKSEMEEGAKTGRQKVPVKKLPKPSNPSKNKVVHEEEEMEEEDETLYEIEFDDDSIDVTSGDDFDLDLKGKDGFREDPSMYEDPATEYDEFSDDEFGDDMPSDLPEAEEEVAETARTIGLGNRPNALPKGARSGPKMNKEHVELQKQVRVLKEKNEEYKKALNLFREKLNEVAVFNANLAYATRLFTEHATTKQEKMDILKRFDETSTLKESKQLYKTLKNEMNTKATVSESAVEKIITSPSKGSGSKEILSENKAYESPQFARMKDLFSKLK